MITTHLQAQQQSDDSQWVGGPEAGWPVGHLPPGPAEHHEVEVARCRAASNHALPLSKAAAHGHGRGGRKQQGQTSPWGNVRSQGSRLGVAPQPLGALGSLPLAVSGSVGGQPHGLATVVAGCGALESRPLAVWRKAHTGQDRFDDTRSSWVLSSGKPDCGAPQIPPRPKRVSADEKRRRCKTTGDTAPVED